MTFNFSSLVNNITGSIKNLGNQLGITDADNLSLNPQYKTILTNIDQVKSNWNKLPLPYTFSVVNISGNPDPNFKDFPLPLAPSNIQQTEEFAVSITPVQGGTIVNHSGNRYKTLRISGTTGLAPFRGTGGVDKYTGEAIFQPNDLKYKSGHEVFIRLRNYFKAYYEYKKNMQNDRFPREARLLFKNYKDGEFLVVELLNFETERNASKSFLYDYKLDFKVLGHFEFKKPGLEGLAALDDKLNRAMNKLDTARGVFLRSGDILKQIESTYESALLEPIRKVSLVLKSGIGLAYNIADFPKNIIKSTAKAGNAIAAISNIKDEIKASRSNKAPTKNQVQVGEFNKSTPDTSRTDILQRSESDLPNNVESFVEKKGAGEALISLNEATLLVDASQLPEEANDALNQEIDDAQNLPKSFFEDSITDIERIGANAEDYFNLTSTDYDTLYNRTKTFTADTNKIISDSELDVLEAFNLTISAIYDLLSTTEAFKSDFDEQIQDLISKFDENELNLIASEAVLQVTVPAKTEIERLALNYLGDESRWPEIAELNDLQHPFITQDPTNTDVHIKKPGDTILIPTPRQNPFPDIPDGKEIPSIVALSKLEKSLGTDLKLTSDFDLALDNSNSLMLISGTENMGQAVVLKIGYEKDELLHSPSIGVGLQVGDKITDIQQIKDNIIRTMNSDNRIERLEDLSIVQNNSTISLYFKVKIKNIDIPVPVSVQI